MNLPSVIAIDGPGASGKSTVGYLTARTLGYRFIDTGAMYRGLTWIALTRQLDFGDEEALVRLAEETGLQVVPGTPEHPQGRLLANGEDLTPFLHLPEVDAEVSLLARIPGVREVLVATQRQLAGVGGVVMAGRDIGTVVLPDADLKVYLDASVEERARRRLEELQRQDPNTSLADVLDDLRRRDALDQERQASPLRPAPDAHVIDTDGLAPEEIAKAIVIAAKAYCLAATGSLGPRSPHPDDPST